MGAKSLFVQTENTVPTANDKFTFANAEDNNQLQSCRTTDLKSGIGNEVFLEAIDAGTDETAADGHTGVAINVALNGTNLTAALAATATKGVTGTTTVSLRRVRTEAALGDSTTQFDISDEGTNTFRYTYDSTGTDPLIANTLASLQAGDFVEIAGQNFNAANNILIVIDAVGTDYFEVTNVSGVAETDKTIGTGSIIPYKHRDMLSTEITIGAELFAADGVINTSYDDVQTGDVVFVDVDAIHSGTAAKGLFVTLTFSL